MSLPQTLEIDDREQLSRRLDETLVLLIWGCSEKEISAALGVSVHTVHVYSKSLYRKFGVCARGELIAKWMVLQGYKLPVPTSAPWRGAALEAIEGPGVNAAHPSGLEDLILDKLEDMTQASVGDLLESLPPMRPSLEPETLQSLLDSLITRNQVVIAYSGRPTMYRCIRAQTQNSIIQRFVRRILAGPVANLVLRVIPGFRASDPELAEIERLLREYNSK